MATSPDDIFADLIPGGQKAPVPVYGTAPKADQPKTTWHTLSEDEAKGMGLAPSKVWQVSSEGETKSIGDASPADLITDQDKDAIRAEALQKLKLGASLIQRSKDGWFTTGFGAKTAAAVSGASPAGGVAADTETLKNAGALQRVIDLNKKTGKNPLTPLSNSDFQALASSITNLDTGQPDEQYQRNVGTVIDIWKRAYLGAGGDPKELDKALAAYGFPPSGTPETPSGSGDGEPPPGVKELSDDQKKAYSAFWAANPSPSADQLNTFLNGIGVEGSVTDAERIIAHKKETGKYSTTVEDLTQRQKVNERASEMTREGGGRGAAFTVGAIDTLTGGFGDELGAGLSALGGADYTTERDANREYMRRLGQSHGGYYTGGQIFGGVLTAPVGGEITTAADAAKLGAAYGGVYGFGSAEGGLPERASSALIGAAEGAVVGAGGQKAISALSPYVARAVEPALPMRLRPGRGMAPDIAEAADRQNVRLIRPMVDSKAMDKFSRLKGTENAGPVIENAANDVRGDIEAAVGRLGQGGNASNREAQGEALRTIAKGIQTANRQGTTAAYDAARTVQPDAVVDPAGMRRAVDDKLAQLSLRPSQNRAEITALKRYRADLDKPLPLQEIRNMRTDAYDNVYGGATSRTAEQKRADRFMMSVVDGANSDIEAALTPEALAAYKEADALHRENKTLYREAFKPLFGDAEGQLDKLSAEQIHDRFKKAVNLNGRAIAAFHRRMPLEQSRDFAATIAEKLGRNAPDDPFDLQTFLNQTKDFSPSATRTLFGPGGEQSVADLRLLSRKLLATGAEKTGDATRAGYLERQSWRQLARAFLGGITGMVKGVGGAAAGTGAAGAGYLGGGVAGMTAAAGTAASIAGGREVSRVLSARAMTNPRVAKWLAQTADVSSHKAAQASVERLGTIIEREPALTQELVPLYDFLSQRLSQPLAANPQPEGDQNDQ